MLNKRVLSAVTASAAAVLGLSLLLPGQANAQAKPGWVTVVLEEEPEGLDGCNANRSTPGRVVRQNVVETLTEINPDDGSITPLLATSWERVNDSTWRFKLRQGVKFHDGEPFNAKNAAWAMSRTLDTELSCETRTKSFGKLKLKGVPVDEYTLDIVATPPDPLVPTRMGVLALVSPKTPLDKLTLTPVGTGAYKVDKWTAGSEIIASKNKDWWGKQTNIEGVRYVWRGESSVRAAMVKVGEADFAPTIGVNEANEPKMDFSYPNSETTKLRIEMGRKPLDDIRVRMALNLAFDRYSVLGTLLPKDSIHATQIVVPSISGHNHEIDKKVRPYDPAKAKGLIAEAKAAGVNVGQEILIIGRTNHFPGISELLETAMQQFNAAGLNTKLKMTEVAEWLEYQNKPHRADRSPILFLGMHDNNNGDAVFSMANKMTCGGLQSFLCNPKVDELIDKATIAPVGPERVKLWQESMRIIYEDMVAHVWLYHMVGYSRVGSRINFKPSISTNSEIQISKMTLK